MGLNIYEQPQRNIIFIELRSNEITFVKASKEHHIYSIYNVFFCKSSKGATYL